MELLKELTLLSRLLGQPTWPMAGMAPPPMGQPGMPDPQMMMQQNGGPPMGGPPQEDGMPPMQHMPQEHEQQQQQQQQEVA